jgi:pimeloyl-ACP methyl ester carboxylesterase
MGFRRSAAGAGVLLVAAAGAAVVAFQQGPTIAANALLHPWRRTAVPPAPDGCEHVSLSGVDVALSGWRCRARGEPRATIVLLHGIADNRGSWIGAIDRLTRIGFDVVAYDSRANGESEGTACTYGFLEKQDLHRVIDTIVDRPVVLIGTSLGAAVALQEAADDPRVVAVVAAETFSDLRTIASERAPFYFPRFMLPGAFARAEQMGGFPADAVSPVDAAARVHAAVLVIHGAQDTDTLPDHSRRVYDALAGPKRLLIVPGAHHNQSLSSPETWIEIDRFVDEVIPTAGRQ